MKKCVLCGKRNGPGSFFKIPSDERRRQQWSNICNMQLKPTGKVCADHFLESDFIVGARLSLMPSAVPSIGIVSDTGTHSLYETVVDTPNASGAELKADPLHCFTMLPNDSGAELTDQIDCFTMLPNASDAELKTDQIHCFTQTDNDVIISNVEIENYKLRNEMRKLRHENTKLKKELESANAIIASMHNIFTEGQIRKMRNPEKSVHWRKEDISSCENLHAAGPGAYIHLYKKGFPLPHVSTLKRCARKNKVNEGDVCQDFMLDENDLLKEDIAS